MIKKVKIEVEGLSALLMHRFPMEPIEAVEKKSAEEQAEISAYRNPESKNLFVPAINIQRSMIAGAAFSKGKRGASLQKSAAACILVEPESLDLGTAKYTIDSRRVVMPSTKGSIIRHRPRLDKWRLQFELDFDDALISESQMRQIIDDTGLRVGLCDFRPEKKGPFGRFKVVHWE